MNTTQIPQTDSIEELAHFWETHDLTDFESELEEVTEPVFERGRVRNGQGAVATAGVSPSQTLGLRQAYRSYNLAARVGLGEIAACLINGLLYTFAARITFE